MAEDNTQQKDNGTVSSTKIETLTTSDASYGTDSSILGVSMRSIIALIITLTLCYMAASEKTIVEPFYSICVFTIGFFFGQKKQ